MACKKSRGTYRHMWKRENNASNPIFLAITATVRNAVHNDTLMQNAAGEREMSEKRRTGSPPREKLLPMPLRWLNTTQETRHRRYDGSYISGGFCGVALIDRSLFEK